jgi:hypothetical protein
MDTSDTKSIVKTLRKLYWDGAAFPEWTDTRFLTDVDILGKEVVVYYDEGDDLDIVKNLVKIREPCNIGGNRCFHEKELEKAFGWKVGYYGTYWLENKKVPPNVSVYCRTPVDYKKNQDTLIHIINSIGYAFDAEGQVDYQYFILGKKQAELQERYYDIFKKVFGCAKEKGLSTIVFSLVGAGNFSTLYENKKGELGNFLEEVWCPAFIQAIKDFGDGKKLLFMGSARSEISRLLKKENLVLPDIGYFPDNLGKFKPEELQSVLFVNAWDPLSFAGNGNEIDNSLDGYIGRKTMIALLCSPLSNYHLNDDGKYRSV